MKGEMTSGSMLSFNEEKLKFSTTPTTLRRALSRTVFLIHFPIASCGVKPS